MRHSHSPLFYANIEVEPRIFHKAGDMEEIMRVLHKAMQAGTPVRLILQFGSNIAEVLEGCEIIGIGKDFVTYLATDQHPNSIEMTEEVVLKGHIRQVGVPKVKLRYKEESVAALLEEYVEDEDDDEEEGGSRFDLC